MDHLHLLIPDLFPSQDIAAEACAGLRLPALEKLLARGQESAEAAILPEDWLCAAFGVHAVAPVRAAADGLDVSNGYWLCADPVNLQLHRSQMMLMPEVGATPEEATALCAELNAHFLAADMQFFAPHPQRWYLRLATAPQLATAPLCQVAWQDARLHQPQGADVLHWQRVMTELQMVLYGHPVNRARETRHEVLISSVWLWGGGVAEPLHSAFELYGGDSALLAAFAKQTGAAWADSLLDMPGSGQRNGLWVYEAAAEARRRGDWGQWRSALLRIEADSAALLRALQSGRLRGLSLLAAQPDRMRRFELTRLAAWRGWRPARSLSGYAV
jgi:hypothetical protein